MATKYYTLSEIQLEYKKFTKDEEIKILYSALGYMQELNGRTTKAYCIALAMGYENTEGLSDTYVKINQQHPQFAWRTGI